MKSSYRDSEHVCKNVVHVQRRLGPGSHLTQINHFGTLSWITADHHKVVSPVLYPFLSNFSTVNHFSPSWAQVTPDSHIDSEPYHGPPHTVLICHMSRKRRKISKDEIEHLYRKCRYCEAHRDARSFDRHETSCKARWKIQNENQHLLRVAIENPSAIPQDRFEVIEGSSKMQVEDVVEAQETLADGLNASWDSGVSEPNPNLSES